MASGGVPTLITFWFSPARASSRRAGPVQTTAGAANRRRHPVRSACARTQSSSWHRPSHDLPSWRACASSWPCGERATVSWQTMPLILGKYLILCPSVLLSVRLPVWKLDLAVERLSLLGALVYKRGESSQVDLQKSEFPTCSFTSAPIGRWVTSHPCRKKC